MPIVRHTSRPIVSLATARDASTSMASSYKARTTNMAGGLRRLSDGTYQVEYWTTVSVSNNVATQIESSVASSLLAIGVIADVLRI